MFGMFGIGVRGDGEDNDEGEVGDTCRGNAIPINTQECGSLTHARLHTATDRYH